VAKLPVITVTHFKRLRYLNFARFSQFIFFEVHCIRLATIPLSDKIRRLRVVNSNTVKKAISKLSTKIILTLFPPTSSKWLIVAVHTRTRPFAHDTGAHFCQQCWTLLESFFERARSRSLDFYSKWKVIIWVWFPRWKTVRWSVSEAGLIALFSLANRI
jgi:hypothetical protein